MSGRLSSDNSRSRGVVGRCCINRARSVDVYAQRSRGQPPIKSDSRVTA
ncbi:MAG: hypothetical protein V3Q69_00265 [Burkholderia sp.]